MSMLLAAVVALSSVLHLGQSLKISIPPNASQCVSQTISDAHFEDMETGERSEVILEGAFFVLGPGGTQMNVNKRRNVNLKVIGPDGKEMFGEQRIHRDKQVQLEMRGTGLYSFCIQNHCELRQDVTVELTYFTLRHMRNPFTAPKKGRKMKKQSQTEHLAAMEGSIHRIKEVVESLNGEVMYLQRRINRHQQTTTSMERRLNFYGALQLLLLLALGAANAGLVTYMIDIRRGRGRRQSSV